ncbi:MAG: hypothetical protein WCA20_11365 [Candidatus Sulfotelmatobacter sp.]
MPDDATISNGQSPFDPDATLASVGPQPATVAAKVPSTIGSYRIIRLLGEAHRRCCFGSASHHLKQQRGGPEALKLRRDLEHGTPTISAAIECRAIEVGGWFTILEVKRQIRAQQQSPYRRGEYCLSSLLRANRSAFLLWHGFIRGS